MPNATLFLVAVLSRGPFNSSWSRDGNLWKQDKLGVLKKKTFEILIYHSLIDSNTSMSFGNETYKTAINIEDSWA